MQCLSRMGETKLLNYGPIPTERYRLLLEVFACASRFYSLLCGVIVTFGSSIWIDSSWVKLVLPLIVTWQFLH
jgi:hypothetical protein